MTEREFLEKVMETTMVEELKTEAQVRLEKLNAKRKKETDSKKAEDEPLKKVVLEYLQDKKEVVASEIAKATPLSISKVTALCKSLSDDGLVTVTQVVNDKKRLVNAYTLV